MVFRIALSSHDSVGLGHVRRHLAIAHALSRSLPELVGEPVTGMIITGQASATSFRAPDGWDWLVLPSVTVGQEGYASRHLTAGIDRVTAMRGGAIDAALQAFGPDLLLIDRHPFGVRRELTTALRNLRTHRPECAVVLGQSRVREGIRVSEGANVRDGPQLRGCPQNGDREGGAHGAGCELERHARTHAQSRNGGERRFGGRNHARWPSVTWIPSERWQRPRLTRSARRGRR